MDAAPLVATMRGTRMPVAKLCLAARQRADKADDLFSLMAEVLTDTNFDNPQRFTQMVLEERARLEQSLIPAGHGTVIARLRAAYSLAGQISEAIGGITYLEAIRALSERVVSDWDSVRADLEILRGLILNRQDAILNLTADAGTLAAVQPYAAALGRALPTAFSVPLEREPAQGRGQRSPYRARTRSTTSGRVATSMISAIRGTVPRTSSPGICAWAGCGIRSACRAARTARSARSIA